MSEVHQIYISKMKQANGLIRLCFYNQLVAVLQRNKNMEGIELQKVAATYRHPFKVLIIKVCGGKKVKSHFAGAGNILL